MINIVLFLNFLAILGVVFASNSILSLLFLILVFLLMSLLFMFLGAPFLAVMILVVYAGALAILFLFVIMLLNIRFSEIFAKIYIYIPVAALVMGVLLMEYAYIVFVYSTTENSENTFLYVFYNVFTVTNVTAIGNFLFSEGCYGFIIVGFILFVGLIGTIILTNHDK